MPEEWQSRSCHIPKDLLALQRTIGNRTVPCVIPSCIPFLALLAPSDIAVTIRGRAWLVKERMETHEHSAILEIDVEQVKNDMVGSGTIGSGITFFPQDDFKDWFEAALGEIDELQ